MIAVKFCTIAGSSPENTSGIDIHAVGATCIIIADWPVEFYQQDCVKKYYFQQELADANTQRMLNAEVDSLKKLAPDADSNQRSSVVLPLPFPVQEVCNPPLKVVKIKKTGTCMITFSLSSTVIPNFGKKTVAQNTEFDD